MVIALDLPYSHLYGTVDWTAECTSDSLDIKQYLTVEEKDVTERVVSAVTYINIYTHICAIKCHILYISLLYP